MHYCNIFMSIHSLAFDRIRLLESPMVYEDRFRWRWSSSCRDHYNLWVCLEGNAQMRCDGVEYKVAPWTAFIIPPSAQVFGQMESGVLRNFSAHWQPVGEITPELEFSAYGIQVSEVEVFQSMVQCSLRLSVFRDKLAKQQRESLILSMLGLLWREEQSPIESSADTIIYRQVERMLAGRDLFTSVDALAKEANLSRMHYSRCFLRIAAASPNQYMIQQRIERACALLRETDWTIAAISENIGYSDSFFFSRQFRHIMGKRPGQYREAQRQ